MKRLLIPLGAALVCGASLVFAQTGSHQNGLGQSYTDPAPPGTPGSAATYSHTMAIEAAQAWPMVGIRPLSRKCGNGAGAAEAISMQSPAHCAVWAYTGPAAGHVRLNTANNTCVCPTVTDPAWN